MTGEEHFAEAERLIAKAQNPDTPPLMRRDAIELAQSHSNLAAASATLELIRLQSEQLDAMRDAAKAAFPNGLLTVNGPLDAGTVTHLFPSEEQL